MAVAFDAVGPGASGTGTVSWTHTPVGTPRAILVGIVQLTTAADQVTGVTYGAVAMTEVALSPLIKASGETNTVYYYFLGASVPTGPQTVEFTVSGSATKAGNSISYTAADDCEIVDTSVFQSDSVSDAAVTVSLAGRSCAVELAGFSGEDAVTSVAPLSGWTSRGEGDFGAQVSVHYSYDTVSTVDVTAGFTQTSDDASFIAVAIGEIVAAGGRIMSSLVAHGGLVGRGGLVGPGGGLAG